MKHDKITVALTHIKPTSAFLSANGASKACVNGVNSRLSRRFSALRVKSTHARNARYVAKPLCRCGATAFLFKMPTELRASLPRRDREAGRGSARSNAGAAIAPATAARHSLLRCFPTRSAIPSSTATYTPAKTPRNAANAAVSRSASAASSLSEPPRFGRRRERASTPNRFRPPFRAAPIDPARIVAVRRRRAARSMSSRTSPRGTTPFEVDIADP
mmetsp:Transcript_9659/g.40988  ORF Transcript_9659/g.40988 Transcript_9659/m.40988 type:complete len:217 (-) Transcript_9659:124-774(-)